jgi:hypothetical protein
MIKLYMIKPFNKSPKNDFVNFLAISEKEHYLVHVYVGPRIRSSELFGINL